MKFIQAERKTAMQKWEYMFAEIGFVGFSQDQPRVHMANGKELPNWKDLRLHDFLSQLGEQGWKLAAPLVCPRSSGWTNGLAFKRPKPQP
jgi:hypothetical protein